MGLSVLTLISSITPELYLDLLFLKLPTKGLSKPLPPCPATLATLTMCPNLDSNIPGKNDLMVHRWAKELTSKVFIILSSEVSRIGDPDTIPALLMRLMLKQTDKEQTRNSNTETTLSSSS